MGFFSSLLKGVGSVIGAVVNPVGTITGLLSGGSKTVTPQVAAIVSPAPLNPLAVARTVAQGVTQPFDPRLAAVSGGGLAGLTGKAIGPGVPKGLPSTPFGSSRGNGRFAKRTIVQTINLDIGAVVNEVIMDGAPFLMNKAVRELARTSKKLQKANAKIPRRTSKESLSKKLTDKVLNETINQVGHHGHHNGNS